MSLGEMNPQEAGRGSYMLKQAANIYTAMLILAFVFVLIGCLFMFLEMKAYELQIKVPNDPNVKASMSMISPPDSSTIVGCKSTNSLGANLA